MEPIAGNSKAINILLVEDSPHYVRLIQETFRAVNGSVRIFVANDGTEALAFLRRQGAANLLAPRPDLILLDLGMPKMDGRTALASIKADEDFRTIPTIVLTTSDAQEDIVTSLRLHANSYLQKPLRLEQLEELLKSVNDFWLVQSKLPDPPRMNRAKAAG